jgi:integrase
LQPDTYYCLLGLLSVSGMRVSEVQNLKLQDLDLKERVLTIRGAKFGKYAACWAMPASRCATANSEAGNQNDSA